jgi:hypothetical protein
MVLKSEHLQLQIITCQKFPLLPGHYITELKLIITNLPSETYAKAAMFNTNYLISIIKETKCKTESSPAVVKYT